MDIKVLNRIELPIASVILFGSLSSLFLAFALVSLVVPFLSDASESASLAESLQLELAD